MTRIFTTTLYGEYENQYIDVTESYDYIKDIMYKYIKNGFGVKNGFGDGFIELHFAKGRFINHPISLRLSSIAEFFDITEDKTNDK